MGEISTYEYKNGRPLISAIAIYKGEREHKHADGSYNLCEYLEIGTAKDLKDNDFGFDELERAKEFWKDESNYDLYYEECPFFNQEEIIFFNKWAGKNYDNNNDFPAKEYILNSVWKKTKFWAELLKKRLDGYEISNKINWDERSSYNEESVVKFKSYTCAKIYKKGDYQKNIFFTIGIDANSKSIVCKLHYQNKNDIILSEEQKQIISRSEREIIPFEDIKMLDWSSLIKTTIDFIKEKKQDYDQLIKIIWKDRKIENIFTDLIRKEKPNSTLEKLPELKPSFKGKEVNFIQKKEEDKKLGNLGEELVRLYEISILEEKGLKELSKKVRIVRDGKGYDVPSFFDNGDEKYIEVKTTCKGEKTEFYLTINERLFAQNNKDNYVIYRLYNYDKDKNISDFF